MLHFFTVMRHMVVRTLKEKKEGALIFTYLKSKFNFFVSAPPIK